MKHELYATVQRGMQLFILYWIQSLEEDQFLKLALRQPFV